MRSPLHLCCVLSARSSGRTLVEWLTDILFSRVYTTHNTALRRLEKKSFPNIQTQLDGLQAIIMMMEVKKRKNFKSSQSQVRAYKRGVIMLEDIILHKNTHTHVYSHCKEYFFFREPLTPHYTTHCHSHN